MRGLLAALGVAITVLAVEAQAAYAPGYVWNRQSVWNGGTGDGSINGNPNIDSMGNPAWLYTARNGAALGSAWWSDPSPSVLGSFTPGGSPAWVGGNAYAFQDRFYHEHGGPAAPGVDWLNPTDGPATVNVSGVVRFDWEQGASNPVDYVIAIRDLETNAASVLFQTTVSPTGNTTVPVSLPAVSLSANQGLAFTYRAQAGSVGLYTSYDAINITLVP